MTALAVRPDLSQRKGLSKSVLSVFDLCATKGWYELHDRRPLIPGEKITFGRALDGAIEQILTAQRAGVSQEEARPLLAAEEVMAADGVEIDLEEVARACGAFTKNVLPTYDFRLCGLQVHLHEDIEGIGEVDGHPDVRLADGSVYDVKSSSKAKAADAVLGSFELGLYALLSEAETGKPCPRVGYWTWCRTAKPSWQVLSSPVTDEMRRRTKAVALAYLRAKAADDLLNRGDRMPLNFSMSSGPKFAGLCRDCQYNPMNGGGCELAVQGATDAD